MTKLRLFKLLVLSLQILLAVLLVQWAPTWGIRAAMAQPDSETVPSQINMFWAGEKLGDTDLANVLAWGKKAEGTQYSVTLWTTKDTRKKLEDSGQLELLKAQGVNIDEKTMAELSPEMQKYFDQAIKTKSFALASDIARYSILWNKGGMYVDTDFGPGDVDLSQPLPQLDIDSTPLFAPMVRTNEAWEAAKQAVPEPKTNERILEELYKNGINNNLIIAPKGSTFLRDLNADVLAKLNRKNEDPSKPLSEKIITNDAAWISGPMVVRALIKSRLEERRRIEAERRENAKSRWRRFWEKKITRKKKPAPIPVTDGDIGDEASVLKHGGDFGQNLSTIDWVTDASDPDRDDVDSNKSDSNKSDSNKSDSNKPDSNKPDSNKPDSNKPDSQKGPADETCG